MITVARSCTRARRAGRSATGEYAPASWLAAKASSWVTITSDRLVGKLSQSRSSASAGASCASRTASRTALWITTEAGSSVIDPSTAANRRQPSSPNLILAQVESVTSGITSAESEGTVRASRSSSTTSSWTAVTAPE